jgi:hypothetical protein
MFPPLNGLGKKSSRSGATPRNAPCKNRT